MRLLAGVVTITASTFTDPITVIGGAIGVTQMDAGTNSVTLTARTGAITDGGDVGTDITGGLVTLNAAGAIGTATATDHIALSATSLVTNTAAANGNQFLTEVDTVDVTSMTAGTGDITVTAGTFLLNGTATAANVM